MLNRINYKLYQFFRIDLQELARKSSLYNKKIRRMRKKVLDKYDGLFDYVIMGHTHLVGCISSTNTIVLDIGCPHLTGTYLMIKDDLIYFSNINFSVGKQK
jgi:hypothetical protein